MALLKKRSFRSQGFKPLATNAPNVRGQSYHSLNYHVVFATKRRLPLLTAQVWPELRDLLLHYCRGKAPTDYLFPRACAVSSTPVLLYQYLRRVCTRLNLPQVCPHSLRGMHATFAIQDGASAEHVAAVLGHGSSEITRRHYIAPGTEREAQARSVAALLLEHGPPHHVQQSAENRGIEQAIAVLRALSPAERAVLLDSVDKRQ